MKENDAVISVFSFYAKQLSYENIEVLEDAELYYLHYNHLQQLYEQFLEANILCRMLTGKYFVQNTERTHILSKETAK